MKYKSWNEIVLKYYAIFVPGVMATQTVEIDLLARLGRKRIYVMYDI